MSTRRDFITLLGGAAAWPLAAHAQQGERVRRIGVLNALPADDPEWQARIAAFHQGLQELGWIVGRNVRIDYRLGPADGAALRRRAAELVALAPDVILVNGTSPMQAACFRPHAACPSCSSKSPTRLAPAMLRAWLGRAATPPGSHSLNTA